MFTAQITVANVMAANAVVAAICVMIGGNANAMEAALG
jgi:hypothetical protein